MSIARYCDKCGTPVPRSESRFCLSCGSELTPHQSQRAGESLPEDGPVQDSPAHLDQSVQAEVPATEVVEEQPGPGSFDAGSTVVGPRRPIWRRWKVIICVPVGILVLLFVLALVFGESSPGGGSDTRCENARDRLDAVGHSLSQEVKIDTGLSVPLRAVGSPLRKELLEAERAARGDVKRYCEGAEPKPEPSASTQDTTARAGTGRDPQRVERGQTQALPGITDTAPSPQIPVPTATVLPVLIPASPLGSDTITLITTASGLQYRDLVVGTGGDARDGLTAVVHYTGWLVDGTKFDSSLDRGDPISFPIGQGRVIQGWDEGVASMNVGGKRELTIPPDLGYGDRGAGGVIPPGATLIFEVELLELR